VVHDLTSRGLGLRVLTGHGAAIDTTTPAGKLVFGIFASLAEFERDLISERTRAGLASARARGCKGGRCKDIRLTRWRTVKGLTREESYKFQQAASQIAKREKTHRVHLDLVYCEEAKLSAAVGERRASACPHKWASVMGISRSVGEVSALPPTADVRHVRLPSKSGHSSAH
jgi:hypothetical protein